MKKSHLRQIIREEIQKLDEATKYDIEAALRDVREYNNGNISLEYMVESIVKNLGFKPNPFNISQTKSHLMISSHSMGDDRIIMDRDVIEELYGILK